ncbi:MAG: M56 family metallopeptidase [Caulobacteraceae bacterium]
MMSQVLDHLWQSTLVALAAAILSLAFRKASAGVRYGLWFAASLKFLVPFAVLVALGRLLAPAGLFPVRAAPDAALIERAARPLAQFPFAHNTALEAPLSTSHPVQAQFAHSPARLAEAAPHLDLGLLLLALWVVGAASVLIAWSIRWTRVRKVVREAKPVAWAAPMPVLASPSLMEPGLVGLWRPVLVIPETLPGHLIRAEIDAILAHEISHLRRRDNLTAAIHMVVEALFWFHPMVWWIGARMIEERERACDEAVVQAGHDRAAYARSLVESCRLYLQSPLSCVAGASGSNLKTRVEAIMTAPATSPLSPLKKALLLAAGACAIATPVAAGLLSSPAGRQAAVRTARLTAAAPSLPAAGPAAAQKPTVLARNEAVLAPALSVSRLDIPATPLSQEISAPQPVQLASAAPPSTRASPAELAPLRAAAEPAALPTDPAEIKRQVADFVKSYGAFTRGDVSRSRQTGRWANPICLRVAGLTPAQETAVRTRIEQVAEAVDVSVRPAGCALPNLEIGFSADPQGQLDSLVKEHRLILGDRTSRTRDAKTVNMPVQAWYLTNGVTFAANDAGGLKALVVYQSMQPGSVGPDGHESVPPGTGPAGGAVCCGAFPSDPPGDRTSAEGRLFVNVLLIVDLRRPATRTRSLGRLADYLAMAALSESRDLGQCNVLPSITDLFAACPDRLPPDGLTPADAAYLTALYAREDGRPRPGDESAIAQRMAKILMNDRFASR